MSRILSIVLVLGIISCAPSTDIDRLRTIPPPIPAVRTYDMFPLSVSGSAAQIRAAVDAGTDVNQRNDFGKTPLLYAAQYNTATAVEQLIVVGAILEARDAQGWTPLMRAIARRDAHGRRVTDLLLRAGADVTAMTGAGETPLTIARRSNDLEIIALIEQATEAPEAIFAGPFTMGEVISLCENVILGRLVAPASAQFAAVSNEGYVSPQRYARQGYWAWTTTVNSLTPFGTMATSRWHCVLHDDTSMNVTQLR